MTGNWQFALGWVDGMTDSPVSTAVNWVRTALSDVHLTVTNMILAIASVESKLTCEACQLHCSSITVSLSGIAGPSASGAQEQEHSADHRTVRGDSVEIRFAVRTYCLQPCSKEIASRVLFSRPCTLLRPLLHSCLTLELFWKTSGFGFQV